VAIIMIKSKVDKKRGTWRNMNKKIDIKFIVMLIIIALIASCSGTGESKDNIVKISDNGTAGQAPIYIALEEGYFEDQGVQVELVAINRSTEAIAAMIGGDIDVVTGGAGASIINTIQVEENIKVVADRGHISKGHCTYMGVLVNLDLFESGKVAGPQDFVNYSIGGNSTGVSAYLMELYMNQAGLSLKDLNLSSIPPSSIEEALANQTIAAATFVAPRISKAVNSGAGVLVAGLEDFVDDYQSSVLSFGKKLMLDNRELGVKFMAGYLLGVKQFNEGQTERNLEIVSKYTQTPVEELEGTCWPLINNDGHINFETFADFQDWSVQEGALEKAITEEEFWDSHFTEEAYKLILKSN
jgi:NitT/TauT family transport system substrate-binding protein